jgi:phospholipase C
VQSQTYKVDGVEVANFLLPLYFTTDEQEGGRNDFLGTLDKKGKPLTSFGIADGGYIGFYNPRTRSHDSVSKPGDEKAAKRLAIKAAHQFGRGYLRRQSQQVQPREFTHKNLLAGIGLQQRSSTAKNDPIKHVVVLMLENRSFDHMLGAMAKVNPAIDGIKTTGKARTNTAPDGKVYTQGPGAANVLEAAQDPTHDHENVMEQIGTAAAPMTGFVADFLKKYPKASPEQTVQIMSYFDVDQADPSRDSLPALHTLARNFAVCDAWYSSMPGPTWQNRFFVHSGTTLGHTDMPSMREPWKFRVYYQPTVYDAMSDANIRWKIYHEGIPQTIVMTRLLTRFLTKRGYADMEDFYTDAAGDASSFPEYSFIEPHYFGKNENDQHPPADVMRGEKLIADVYNAIRANDALWKSTLLIVTYDEHGGFYDHVYPPATVAPDNYTSEWSFDQLGVRVPAILVSPWVEKGVVKTTLEHTSILRYVCEKWSLPPLGQRMQAGAGALRTNTFAAELSKLPVPREDTPAQIKVQLPKAAVKAIEPPIEGSREALLAYVQTLPSPVPAGRGVKAATKAKGRKAMGSPAAAASLNVEDALAKLDALRSAEMVARSVPQAMAVSAVAAAVKKQKKPGAKAVKNAADSAVKTAVRATKAKTAKNLPARKR